MMDADVVIAGAGPVGLGLAIQLGQAGVRTIIVEKHDAPQPIPKGQNLTQRTMEHFHFWGIEQAVREARTIPSDYGIGGMTSYGQLLSEYTQSWLPREKVRDYYYTANERLPQYATEQVLRRRVAELPVIRLITGWAVEGFEQDQTSVAVAVAERNGAGRRTLTGRYLVGCDGSGSAVRETASITETLSDHNRTMALLVFRSERLNDLLERYPGKSFYKVIAPELGGYWYFFGRVDLNGEWFFHAPVPDQAVCDDFDFEAFLHRAAGAEFDVDIRHKGLWKLRFAIADRYRSGRVFVAGDAAHSHPPYGGYGINTGLEDARNLGWKLAAVLNGWGGDRLLDSYHDERHAVFASTARDFIERSITDDRNFLLVHSPQRDREDFAAAWRERERLAAGDVAAFEPNYRGSRIVCGIPGEGSGAVGTHEFKAMAGRHLAPLALSDGTNVYAALPTGFALLALGADRRVVDAFRDEAIAAGIPLKVIEDDGEELRRRYEAPLILVRPDQFVAFAGDSDAEDVPRIFAVVTGKAAI